MSEIFEIFGYRLNDNSEGALWHRKKAWCPFMNAECDGGGNRYLTTIDLTRNGFEQLKEFYPDKDKVVPGVCSLEPVKDQTPWIVCPRRLLVLGRQHMGTRTYQQKLEDKLLGLLKYPPGTKLGVWREVKINHLERKDEVAKKFDYTFDYVLMPIANVSIIDTIDQSDFTPNEPNSPDITTFGKVIEKKRQQLEKRGFIVSQESQIPGEFIVHDYPIGRPSIIEVMTSSTSGGDRKKRTQIAQAFEDALLGSPHKGPSINYRQVWARMASQLLVKSEVALGWGGIAIWVVQDVLVDYISQSTGLNVREFIKDRVDEVNMLSFSYGDRLKLNQGGVIDLPQVKLFAGPVAPVAIEQAEAKPSFIDIIRLPVQPPISKLIKNLTDGGPVPYKVVVPV